MSFDHLFESTARRAGNRITRRAWPSSQHRRSRLAARAGYVGTAHLAGAPTVIHALASPVLVGPGTCAQPIAALVI